MASIPWSVAEDSLDVNFSVPQVLRLRCTRDCFADDWDQVVPLLKSDSSKARVQVWVDRSVAESNPTVLQNLSRRIAESDDSIELVAPIALVDGGEQIKNDPQAVESIFARSTEMVWIDVVTFSLSGEAQSSTPSDMPQPSRTEAFD